MERRPPRPATPALPARHSLVLGFLWLVVLTLSAPRAHGEPDLTQIPLSRAFASLGKFFRTFDIDEAGLGADPARTSCALSNIAHIYGKQLSWLGQGVGDCPPGNALRRLGERLSGVPDMSGGCSGSFLRRLDFTGKNKKRWMETARSLLQTIHSVGDELEALSASVASSTDAWRSIPLANLIFAETMVVGYQPGERGGTPAWTAIIHVHRAMGRGLVKSLGELRAQAAAAIDQALDETINRLNSAERNLFPGMGHSQFWLYDNDIKTAIQVAMAAVGLARPLPPRPAGRSNVNAPGS